MINHLVPKSFINKLKKQEFRNQNMNLYFDDTFFFSVIVILLILLFMTYVLLSRKKYKKKRNKKLYKMFNDITEYYSYKEKMDYLKNL